MDWTLYRNDFGRLVLVDAQGTAHVGVVPVRAFPIAAPLEGLSLVGPDGHELAWVDRLETLPQDLRHLIEDELAPREFVPTIQQLIAVSSFATPSTWSVVTDRGPLDFVLKAEEDIRRIAGNTLLIADSNGLQFLIKDSTQLDKVSKKLLDRFR